MTNKDTRNIILSIYDTLGDQSLWPSVLDSFAQQLNAQGCIIFEWQMHNSERRLIAPFFSTSYKAEKINTYIEECFEYETSDQDIFEAHSLQNDNIDLIDDTVLAQSVNELKQRKNVVVLQKLGILHRAAGLLNKDNTMHSRFSVQLNKNRGRPTPDERLQMAIILPHIAKALDLGRPARQLALEHQNLLSAMDRLNIGICFLDARGCIVFANNEFKRQQESYRVFETQANGVLIVRADRDQRKFAALKSDVMNHGRFGARPRKEAVSTEADTFLCIEVTPLAKSEEIGSKAFNGFILYSIDTSLPIICNTEPIKLAYGLTNAELALVNAIAEGLTNAQIAERRDRSVATINAQVKSILSKTQCSTRTQFVRLMLSFGADYLSKSTDF